MVVCNDDNSTSISRPSTRSLTQRTQILFSLASPPPPHPHPNSNFYLSYLISRYLYVSNFLISPPSAVKPLTTSARAKSQTEGLEKDLERMSIDD